MMPHQNVVVSDAKPGFNPAVTVAQKPPAVPRGHTPRCRRVLKDLEINGEQVINAWVDSMRASSPTNAKTTPSLAEEQYKSWILRNPSALDMFEQIVDASEGKQIVMFLDYDGTLSPIVDDPDHAYMSDSMRQTVRKLARCFTTAIVTGRCIEKANYFIRLAELYYAGCHGMDIKGPSKISKINKDKKSEEVVFQPASEFLPMINEVYQQLLEECKSTPGAIVEYNKFCTSVHYRLVDEKKWGELALKVRSVLKEYPKLCLTQGRKVFEIRPFIKWDKGMALEFLLTTLGFDNSNDVFPIYIGDDKTDEDAFKKLRDLEQGVGILVSKFPKDTIASYSLREPNEVMDFLQRLVEWKQVRARSPVQL